METLRNTSIIPASGVEAWAVWLSAQALSSLGPLRLRPGLQILADDEGYWLQGAALTPELDLTLRTIPGATRFTIDAERRLIPVDGRVPSQVLPIGKWVALSSFLTLESPTTKVSPTSSLKVDWVLERSEHERPASVLMLPLSVWAGYAEHAPNVRLNALRMCVSDDARVVLRGFPLPPLRGSWYVEEGGVALPLGWSLVPFAEPEFWRTVFGSTPGDLVLLEADGTYEFLPAAGFQTATRSAIRATVRGLPA